VLEDPNEDAIRVILPQGSPAWGQADDSPLSECHRERHSSLYGIIEWLEFLQARFTPYEPPKAT